MFGLDLGKVARVFLVLTFEGLSPTIGFPCQTLFSWASGQGWTKKTKMTSITGSSVYITKKINIV